jgi:hypothetical protein
MKQRPKRTPGELESKAGRVLRAALEYHALALLQRPFGFVFWLIEQRKARLQDRFENERSDS